MFVYNSNLIKELTDETTICLTSLTFFAFDSNIFQPLWVWALLMQVFGDTNYFRNRFFLTSLTFNIFRSKIVERNGGAIGAGHRSQINPTTKTSATKISRPSFWTLSSGRFIWTNWKWWDQWRRWRIQVRSLFFKKNYFKKLKKDFINYCFVFRC